MVLVSTFASLRAGFFPLPMHLHPAEQLAEQLEEQLKKQLEQQLAECWQTAETGYVEKL